MFTLFFLLYTSATFAGDPQIQLKTIDGCNTKALGVKLQYLNEESNADSCDDSREINPALAAFLKQNLRSCIAQSLPAAKSQGIETGDILLLDRGIAGDQRHSSTSWHSQFLAIDLVGFSMQGKRILFENPAAKEFFQAFRTCWGRTVEKHAQEAKKQCSLTSDSFPTGSVGKEDPNHQHHLHLSLPCNDYRINKSVAFDEMDEA